MSVLSVVLGLDAKKFKSGMAGAAGYAQSYGSAIRGSLLSALGPVAIALETLNLMREGFNQAANVADLSERYGVSADALQRLAFVGKKAGIEMGEIAKLMKQLNKAMAEGAVDPKKAEMLEKMGIDLVALRNGTLTATDAFFQISAGLDGASNKGEVLLALYDMLGRSGETMATLLSKSDEELRKMFEDATVMTDAQIEQADILDDQFNTIVEGAKVAGMWIVLLIGTIVTGFGLVAKALAYVFLGLYSGFLYTVKGMMFAWMSFKKMFGLDTTETQKSIDALDAHRDRMEKAKDRAREDMSNHLSDLGDMAGALIGKKSSKEKVATKKGRDIEGLTDENKAKGSKEKGIAVQAIQAVGGGGLVAGPSISQQQVDIAKKQLEAQNLTNEILEYYGLNKDGTPMTTGGYPGHAGDYL
jgi:hypothetical protein